MLLREVSGWPPTITDSQTFKVVASECVPAKLKRCGVYSIAGHQKPYLSIVVAYQGRDWHAMIQDAPEELLKRIEATLNIHAGRPLAELSEVEIISLE